MDRKARAESELEAAEAARARGNEGMARVCARRAAGWAAEAYLQERGQSLSSPSVLEQMRHLIKVGELHSGLLERLEHLLTPKKRDAEGGDSYFPLDVDLVADARELVTALFPEG